MVRMLVGVALLAAWLTSPVPAKAEGSIEPVEVSAVIQAPVNEVWHAWTTNEGMQSFLVESSNIELRPGGPYEVYFSMQAPEGSRGSENCTVLSYLPERMFSFQWNAPPQFEHARFRHTWVVIEFEPLTPEMTRLVLTHTGFADQAEANPDHKAEWEEVRAYFAAAWPHVVGALRAHFAPEGPDPRTEAQRALELAHRMVGGEWVLEHRQPNGAMFYSRNIIREAPDGKALVGDGWLGSDRGMFGHAATQMWIDPATGLLRFQSLTETGSVMRGHLEIAGDDTLIEHIELVGPEGVAGRFTATLIFKDENTYDMLLQRGDAPPGAPMTFRRVDKAPEKLRTLTDGTVID